MSARPKTHPLTPRQQLVLQLISESATQRGRPPTLREIGQRLRVASTNAVRDHLRALAEKGYISREGRSARGIRLLRSADGKSLEQDGRRSSGVTVAPRRSAGGGQAWPTGQVTRVPLLGRVAAGEPVLADQNVERYLTVDRQIVRDGDVFALRVQGDSMRDAGILDGDYVFVRQQSTAQPRDIVVALLGDETTVKRFIPEEATIRLQPENPAYEAIVVRRDDPRLVILGKVSAVLRTIY